MSILSGWVISILSVIILGVIADLSLSGRLKNFCRSMFSTVAVLVIVMPLPAVVHNGCGSIEEIFDSSVNTDGAYVSASTEYVENKIAEGIIAAFRSDGVKGIEVKVKLKEGSYTEIQNIKIYLKNSVIENQSLHINKYDYLKKKVTEYSGVSEEMIFIYE